MNNNLPKLFLIISLFFGTILLFIVPSFNSPDEDSHFLYSYEISKLNLIPKVKNKVSGFEVPNSIFDSISKTKKITEDRTKKYKYSQMYYDQLLTQNYDETSFSNAVIQSTPKIVYLAPTLGIWVSSLIKMHSGNDLASTHVMLQFARFFSLIIYSIIGYFAIKITPKFKKSFFVILLMPLSVFLRSMVTYDGILLVVLSLTIANILKLINKESEFTKKDLILFIVTGFILLNVKMVYSIVFLGLLAIPNEVFNNKKNKVKQIIKICIFILVLTILQKLPYMFLDTTSTSSISEQLSFIISNPFGYLKILASNIIGQRRIQEYWMLGTFGYLDTYMPVLYVFILKTYLIIIFVIDCIYEKIKMPLWLKIGYLLLVIFDICGMYTIMYIDWTPKVTGVIGSSEITGIQGRYYLPFLLLIPLIFNTSLFDKLVNKEKLHFNKYKEFVDNNFHYITIASLVIMVIIVFMRYYC